jgi:hypothetical protein
VTDPSRSVAKDLQNTADAAAVVAAADYLAVRAQKISDLIKSIDEANQTPVELLDIESGQGDDAGDTGTQAEYFLITARECRDKIQAINKIQAIHGALRNEGWSDTGELLLVRTFVDLNDAWGTYKCIFEIYRSARWGEQPSPHHVLMGLQEPRRNYINALKAYSQQLDVVRKHVEAIKPKTSQ